MENKSVREVVEHMGMALVDHPEEVRVHEITVPNSNLVILNLQVAPHEIGMVIGREGRLADAIRTILAAAGRKNDQRFLLEITEREK